MKVWLLFARARRCNLCGGSVKARLVSVKPTVEEELKFSDPLGLCASMWTLELEVDGDEVEAESPWEH